MIVVIVESERSESETTLRYYFVKEIKNAKNTG